MAFLVADCLMLGKNEVYREPSELIVCIPMVFTSESPRRKHYWLSFSLRSLLVLTTLMACFLGWVAKERQQSKFEQKVGKKLEEKKCGITFLGPYDSLELHDKQKPQGWWRDLLRQVLGERICTISLDSYLAPGNFTLLTGLKNLKRVWVRGKFVSNLTPLAGMKDLQHLTIRGTLVSDLTPLAGLTNLTELSFLNAPAVGDLTPLAGLKNLKYFTVRGTPVADEQTNSLQLALPNCKIRIKP